VRKSSIRKLPSVCTWLGSTKARICPTTWTDSKWRPVPLKREDFLIPNQIGTYLCGSKNGREICYRTLDCREMGVKVLKVYTMAWAILVWRPDRCVRPRTCKGNMRFTHDHERLRNVSCFECKSRTLGPLETFGSRLVVGWMFRFRYIDIFGRPWIDRPQEVNSMLKWRLYHLGLKVSLPPPYLYRNDFSQSG